MRHLLLSSPEGLFFYAFKSIVILNKPQFSSMTLFLLSLSVSVCVTHCCVPLPYSFPLFSQYFLDSSFSELWLSALMNSWSQLHYPAQATLHSISHKVAAWQEGRNLDRK